MKEVEVVDNLLDELTRALIDKDEAKIAEIVKSLDKNSTKIVSERIAHRVFQHEDAIEVLTRIGSQQKYTKDLSKAIKDEAHRRSRELTTMHVPSLLSKILVDQISREDMQISSNAIDAIVSCTEKLGPSFAEPIIRDITEIWTSTLNSNSNKQHVSTVAVRCASAIMMLIATHEAIIDMAQPATEILLHTLQDSSDPLLQMSILDLFSELLVKPSLPTKCQHWLFSEPVLQPLLLMAGATESDDVQPDPILGGPSLRVLAGMCKLGHQNPGLMHGEKLLQSFHRAIHQFEKSELDRLAIIDAISSFASASADALDLILNDRETLQLWLNLAVAQPRLKSAILQSLSMVLAPVKQIGGSDTIMSDEAPNANGLKLYASMGQLNNCDSTELVLTLARNPMPEIRIAAYSLLASVAKLKTGSQVLLTHTKFYDFLISREGEPTKEGKEAKFNVVKAVLESEVTGLLADNIVKALEAYVKEGPFYMKSVPWDVATE